MRPIRQLWFKQWMVPDILSGAKADTLRRGDVSAEIGSTIRASVGPRPPFALLEVTGCEVVDVSAVEPERRARLLAIYPDVAQVTRIAFRARPVA